VVAYAGVLAGCGDSESFTSTGSVTNITQVVNSLSGLTGDVQIQTLLAPDQVAAQSISIIESDEIPAEVNELRFTGYDVNGFPIYGALRGKAANITLVDVPIEVVSLRVELLVDGLIVGGLSTPVTVVEDETTVLTNPTYIFPGVANGPAGPTGPTGPSGPSGPEGPPGNLATAYGSWATADGEFQSITETGGQGNNRFLDFPRVFASEGVARVGDAQGEEEAVYQVDTEGDYLVTYVLTPSEANVFASPKLVFLVLNGGVEQDSFFWNFNFFGSSQTLQLIVSLDAGESVAMGLDAPDNDRAGFGECTLSIVRLGPSSNTALPDSTPAESELG
jgi:hypothetical protein